VLGDLPEDLIFKVSYLGGEMPTFALNFSRPGAQVLLQYYNFLRLGRSGYTAVQKESHDVARYLAGQISKIAPFELWNDASDIPVFAWHLKAGYHGLSPLTGSATARSAKRKDDTAAQGRGDRPRARAWRQGRSAAGVRSGAKGSRSTAGARPMAACAASAPV
jgi:glutamate/tyrosine decarboxylase-like PLP-dependent enzyme